MDAFKAALFQRQWRLGFYTPRSCSWSIDWQQAKLHNQWIWESWQKHIEAMQKLTCSFARLWGGSLRCLTKQDMSHFRMTPRAPGFFPKSIFHFFWCKVRVLVTVGRHAPRWRSSGSQPPRCKRQWVPHRRRRLDEYHWDLAWRSHLHDPTNLPRSIHHPTHMTHVPRCLQCSGSQLWGWNKPEDSDPRQNTSHGGHQSPCPPSCRSAN